MFNFFSKSKEPIDLWFNTDIHAHILPGVDDGSPDVETSLKLVGELRSFGLKKILASPHITGGTFENTPATLDAAQAELDKAMADAGMTDIIVRHHAENRLDDLFIANFKAGTLLTMPDNYVLIENSFIQEPWDLDQNIFDLQVRGYNPIMAHPERFTYYQDKPRRYEELHRNVPFQINVLSLAGHYGKATKRMAEQLIEGGMVDFLGTDTHGMKHIETIRAYLASRDAQRHRKLLEGKIRNHIFD